MIRRPSPAAHRTGCSSSAGRCRRRGRPCVQRPALIACTASMIAARRIAADAPARIQPQNFAQALVRDRAAGAEPVDLVLSQAGIVQRAAETPAPPAVRVVARPRLALAASPRVVAVVGARSRCRPRRRRRPCPSVSAIASAHRLSPSTKAPETAWRCQTRLLPSRSLPAEEPEPGSHDRGRRDLRGRGHRCRT